MEEKGCEIIGIKGMGKMLVNLPKTVSCYVNSCLSLAPGLLAILTDE